MPVTKKLPLLGSFQGWMNESPSVLDAPGEELGRKVGRFLGLDDPNTGISDMMSPMNAGASAATLPLQALITIFKNKAAREVATKEFLESAQRMGMPNLDVAANSFADRYPRVAAHMRMTPEIAPGGSTLADVNIPAYGVRKPVPMRLGNSGIDKIDNSVAQATETLFHEGTHVAQALGDKRFGPLYDNANTAVGYRNIPYEVNARQAGEKAAGLQVGPYVPAQKQLQSIAQQPKGIIEHLYGLFGKEHPATRAKSRIQELTNKGESPSLAALWGEPK